MSEQQMPFYGHLAEFRKRIIMVMVVFIVATLGSFTFTKPMADFIMRPATGLKFVYLSPPDLFIALSNFQSSPVSRSRFPS